MEEWTNMNRYELERAKRNYQTQYREYTPESVAKAIDYVIKKDKVLSAQSVHYALVPLRFGGLGMGVEKKVRKVI